MRIVAYDVDTGATSEESTTDEESSGIIDASRFLGKGTFLFDAQVHKRHPQADKVEYGQMLTLRVRSWKAIFDVGDRP